MSARRLNWLLWSVFACAPPRPVEPTVDELVALVDSRLATEEPRAWADVAALRKRAPELAARRSDAALRVWAAWQLRSSDPRHHEAAERELQRAGVAGTKPTDSLDARWQFLQWAWDHGARLYLVRALEADPKLRHGSSGQTLATQVDAWWGRAPLDSNAQAPIARVPVARPQERCSAHPRRADPATDRRCSAWQHLANGKSAAARQDIEAAAGELWSEAVARDAAIIVALSGDAEAALLYATRAALHAGDAAMPYLDLALVHIVRRDRVAALTALKRGVPLASPYVMARAQSLLAEAEALPYDGAPVCTQAESQNARIDPTPVTEDSAERLRLIAALAVCAARPDGAILPD